MIRSSKTVVAIHSWKTWILNSLLLSSINFNIRQTSTCAGCACSGCGQLFEFKKIQHGRFIRKYVQQKIALVMYKANKISPSLLKQINCRPTILIPLYFLCNPSLSFCSQYKLCSQSYSRVAPSVWNFSLQHLITYQFKCFKDLTWSLRVRCRL